MEYLNFPEKDPNEIPSTDDGPTVQLPKKNRFSGWLRSLLVFIVLVALIAGSFLISFQLGKKILFSVKKPMRESKTMVLEPPPSYEALVKLEKALRAGSKEKPAVKKKSVKRYRRTAYRSTRSVAARRSGTYYKVQIGPFRSLTEAKYHLELVKKRGFDAFLKKYGSYWKIQAGAYKSLKTAKQQQQLLLKKEFKSKIIIE
ncbi:MAG: SPOR domain-containing protein [Candidatus Margulisbacteria bacterium]|nr:SPOR domain-containing protein [Candidatus Margulisiibacteriota bacterium]